MNPFLTTREVANLLRVKERKVYELVAEQAIPVSRVTGKMLFPRDLVEAWVRRRVEFAGATADLAPPPPVLAGSHDPLLEWAIRESGSEIATFFGGSIDGLTRVTARKAFAAGMHVFDPETREFNLSLVASELAGQPVVMVEWAWRAQGLVVASGNPRRLASAADLGGVRFIPPPTRSGKLPPAAPPARRGRRRAGFGGDARSSRPHRSGRRPARARRARRCRPRGGDRGPDAPARLHSPLS